MKTDLETYRFKKVWLLQMDAIGDGQFWHTLDRIDSYNKPTVSDFGVKGCEGHYRVHERAH